MSLRLPTISGIGSVSPYGTLAGAIEGFPLEPRQINRWPVEGMRRGYLVEPFRPADVVPGLKTRRLDRLSVWALVAASLAIKDAGLDLGAIDRSRTGVVCATGLGCIELTEAFLQSAVDHGWSQTDPIIFPETLGNSPASHVARCLEISGPNITLSGKGQAGECALLQAASLLRNRQVDRAIVIAGDTLTRTAYEWYEAAGRLASEGGFTPGEAVTAMVLELDTARAMRPYARLRAGSLARGAEPAALIRKMLDGLPAGQSVRCSVMDRSAAAAVSEVLGDRAVVVTEGHFARGLGDTGALLRLATALNAAPAGTLLLFTGIPSKRGFATLLMEVA
jgi:3-oxoacyl-(acyl-carrier-protein) synthase